MRVYIAGPYTSPSPILNTRRALKVGSQLLDAGHTPFVPHLSLFWDLVYPREYENWIQFDLAWLSVCYAMVRLTGNSPGADIEEDRAITLGIPVFKGTNPVAEFLLWAEREETKDGKGLQDIPCKGG